MRAMLTRDADFFVPLGERVRKARVQADLFVSIHADAFVNLQAGGAWCSRSATAAQQHRGALDGRQENAADLVGGINVKNRHADVMRTCST